MNKATTLGSIVHRLRMERSWTLADMSAAVGIPVSTLSKIENDKLTLSYDKLQQLSRSLAIPMAALFADSAAGDHTNDERVTARRSIASLDRALKIETNNYDYFYFCTELRHRRMIPVLTQVTARSLTEFGELVRHSGEEFVYVLDGAVDLHTEFYAPARLGRGEGVYIDSNMGHAYVLAEGCAAASMLVVCAAGSSEDLARQLIEEAQSRPRPTAVRDKAVPRAAAARAAR